MPAAQTSTAMGGRRQSGKRSHSDRASTSLAALSKRPLPGTILCMLMVLLAIVLGGGGTVNPQAEMVLQVLVVALIIPLVISAKWQVGIGPVDRGAWLLAVLIMFIPIIQLIPLPPSIWQSLPGRSLEVQALAAADADHMWMPLTMAPARTFASLLAMASPVLVLLAVSRLSLRGRNWVTGAIVVGAVLSLILGVLQLSQTGGWTWSLYSEYSEGFLVGFQANRNAEVDVLLIALLAVGVLGTIRLRDGRHHVLTWSIVGIALLVLVVGVFMTGSRTGIAILLPTLVVLAAMFWPILRQGTHTLRWVGGGIVGLGLAAALLAQLQAVQKVVDRFSIKTEARWDLWTDTWYAIGRVWPFGSGIGTIVPMLEAAERLDVVDTTRPVRAHNDWLEWTLEAGLPGLAVLGLILLVVGWLALRALISASRSGTAPARRAQVIFGCGVLLVEGLHACVDYPMRSMSLAILTAVAVAFLLEPAAPQQNKV
ncbi:O-antigen ligase family protein [Novosphingobium sp.]|uniref:O-antigen ligase family protein n=1 Tax=Novosphingobium sp. TaxID=1874826 RepID=UPI003BAA7FD9